MPGAPAPKPPAPEVKPVEAPKPVEGRPAEAPKPAETPPAAPAAGTTAPPKPTLRQSAGAAGRRIGGAATDTLVKAIQSRPVHFAASAGAGIVAFGAALWLGPKLLDMFLSSLGASEQERKWIYTAIAICTGVVIFYVAWRWARGVRRRLQR